MELLYVSIMTECVCPPPSVLVVSPVIERRIRKTCSFLPVVEGVPNPFSGREDVLSLLQRE
jgi:hypothetical protein